MIQKNGEGILGFITNHGYLDNPTFRGMRWHLLNTFDKIYVLDLHGNSKKKEISPDGSPDVNVFDIQQGVAIIIAVKKKVADTTKPLAQIWHGDLWGNRNAKYELLWRDSTKTASSNKLPHKAPHYPFVVRDYDVQEVYDKGFSIAELMPVNSVGIVTARDELTIDMDRETLWQRVQDFTKTDAETLRTKYDLGKDVRDWRVGFAKADVIAHFSQGNLLPIAYRPFDTRWTYYTGKSRGFHCYPRDDVMRHLAGDNLALQVSRQRKSPGEYTNFLVHSSIAESSLVSNKTSEIGNSMPLYLYADPNKPVYTESGHLDESKRLNFDSKLYAAIRKAAGLMGKLKAPDGTDAFRTAKGDARPDEVKVFDYIYGVLHAPNYRETYREFLKIDFPRIPYPKDPAIFKHVSDKGEALRRLHLMEEAAIGATPYAFEGDGDSVVDKLAYVGDKVWINRTQHFTGVSQIAWEFHIGGYQPAQKWLKDRKGRALSWDDIRHYQKIIKILNETDRIMKDINLPLD
jgi:predicted helicase